MMSEQEIKQWEWEHVLRHQISSVERVVSLHDGLAVILVSLKKNDNAAS
jgi:hypothetical protein